VSIKFKLENSYITLIMLKEGSVFGEKEILTSQKLRVNLV